jgi:acetoin:2,6-dichlorophenolindophenol oxidoreductase subunit alpha
MVEPDSAALVNIYRRASTIRQCDERFLALLTAGEVWITYYSPRGQEVISAALAEHLAPTDYLVTTYRGLHDHIAKGVPLNDLWAEFLGRANGTCKGKGGPMHLTHPASGLMVTTGVVGSGLPIANGLALASQMSGDGRVTICNFGDGSTNIGAFHEALNLATLWNLPAVFVCQNNLYGEKTPFAHHTKAESIAIRGSSYAMPSFQVDGNDAVAMWRAGGEAIARARSGGGPTLLEAMTFRFRGHAFGDDSSYMPSDQVARATERDSVPRLRTKLIRDGHLSEADVKELEDEISALVEAACDYALNSPYPGEIEITRDIYREAVEV